MTQMRKMMDKVVTDHLDTSYLVFVFSNQLLLSQKDLKLLKISERSLKMCPKKFVDI